MLKILKHFKNPRFKEVRVLVSGRFVSYMIEFKKNSHHIKKLLGKANLIVTRCSLKESDFGNELEDKVIKRMNIKLAECRHGGGVCEERLCLGALLANGNEAGYFVAAATKAEVDWLQQLPNVPVLYGECTQIVLRKVPELQQQMTGEGA